jgi:predicted MFS family arabinose efflux permease
VDLKHFPFGSNQFIIYRMKSKSAPATSAFTGYQKFVIALLAFLQFTIILDFMVISPLGAILMPALKIGPSQFGIVVSAYAFSAGISGLLAAGFADRYDRKKLLLFFYGGFVFGTLLCGIAPTFPILLAARMVTGVFGGVIGSIVFAIMTDLFPLEKRGRVMGFLQTAFAASQVLGLPAGIFFSNLWGWHAPFLMIVAVSSAVGVIIQLYLRPIDAHLKLHSDRSPLHHLKTTLATPRYLFAFAATGLLSIGGYMLMPFGSAYTVHNLGISVEKLPLIYMVTGISSIFLGPLVGRVADSYGKYRTFVFGSVVSVIMVLIYTNLGPTQLWLLIFINSIMFVGIFSRMIPSQALMSAIPEPASRGSFMSVSSSLQQISGGFASVLAGLIVVQGEGGQLLRFNCIGYVMVGTVTMTVVMMYFIQRDILARDKTVHSGSALVAT